MPWMDMTVANGKNLVLTFREATSTKNILVGLGTNSKSGSRLINLLLDLTSEV